MKIPPAFRHTAALGFFTAAVKLAGAAKVVATARYFGAGDTIDAFLTAFLLPSFIADVFAGSLTPALVPALIESEASEPRSADRLAQAALTLGLSSMTAMAILLAIAGPWALPLLGTSFSPPKLKLTTTLFLMLLLWLPMSGCIGVLRAVLNARDRFAIAALAPVATPLATILALATLAPRWGVYALCIGTLAGVFLEVSALAIAVRAAGYSLLPSWFGWTSRMKTVTGQYLPLVLGSMLSSGSLIVDQAFAGMLGSGAVAVLSYGNKLASVMVAVAATALSTAALPAFARAAALKNWPELRRTALIYACLGLAIAVPATAAVILWSQPIVRIFYQHGSFNASVTPLVSVTQKCAMLQIPFAILLTLAIRLASAMSANALLVRTAIAGFAVNALADFWFAKLFGVAGIALSTAVVQFVSLILLVSLLLRRQPELARAAR